MVFSKQFALVIFSDSAAVRSGKIGNLGEVEREVFLSEMDLIHSTNRLLFAIKLSLRVREEHPASIT